MLDRQLKIEIMATVRRAMEESLEGANEVWLSGKQLSEQFSMFTPNWLEEYGELLPRTQAIVTDSTGKSRATRWAYPRNKIQRMVREGHIKQFIYEK